MTTDNTTDLSPTKNITHSDVHIDDHVSNGVFLHDEDTHTNASSDTSDGSYEFVNGVDNDPVNAVSLVTEEEPDTVVVAEEGNQEELEPAPVRSTTDKDEVDHGEVKVVEEEEEKVAESVGELDTAEEVKSETLVPDDKVDESESKEGDSDVAENNINGDEELPPRQVHAEKVVESIVDEKLDIANEEEKLKEVEEEDHKLVDETAKEAELNEACDLEVKVEQKEEKLDENVVPDAITESKASELDDGEDKFVEEVEPFKVDDSVDTKEEEEDKVEEEVDDNVVVDKIKEVPVKVSWADESESMELEMNGVGKKAKLDSVEDVEPEVNVPVVEKKEEEEIQKSEPSIIVENGEDKVESTISVIEVNESDLEIVQSEEGNIDSVKEKEPVELADESVSESETVEQASILTERKSEPEAVNDSTEVTIALDTPKEESVSDPKPENVENAETLSVSPIENLESEAAKSDVVVESDVVDGEKKIDQSVDVEVSDRAISDGVELVKTIDENGNVATTEKVEEEVKKQLFHYLIRLPKYVDDDTIGKQIRLADQEVQDLGRRRDAINAEIQPKKVIAAEYRKKLDAARAEERAARDVFSAKQQERESVMLVINRMKEASSIDDITDEIKAIERRIGHETMTLNEEKQLIREINQKKQQLQQVRTSFHKQAEVQPTVEEREKAFERLKAINPELDAARSELKDKDGLLRAAKKLSFNANDELKEMNNQFRAANYLRQQAWSLHQNLKKQLYEKNKYFRTYKGDWNRVNEFKDTKNIDGLQNFCVNQVEEVMKLWNNDDDFRIEYIRCNKMSTVRRFKTLDGRQLGPDEEPLVPINFAEKRIEITALPPAKMISSAPVTSKSEQEFPVLPRASEKLAVVKPVANLEQLSNEADVKLMVKVPANSKKPVVLENGPVSMSESKEAEKKREEEAKQAKAAEEEMARKTAELAKREEARKEEEIERKERRLEEIRKAKEAEERKRRNAEKAQAKAELRAQKEAELKEKEREKRARKKQRKNGNTATAEATAGAAIERDFSTSFFENTQPEIIPEPELQTKPAPTPVVAKRHLKPSKQIKTKAAALPPPLRNRGKRRMQTWMWVLLVTVIVLLLFLIGNHFKFDLASFGF